MRSVMSVSCVALLLAAACSKNTAPNRSSIVGSWVSAREDLQPRGSMQTYLAFSQDGTFKYEVYSYGAYGGNDLAAYIRISGTYYVNGDRVGMTANRTATWDSFYGASSPERVEQVTRSVFDQAKFRITWPTLTLDYITYPADALVATTQSFMSLRID
jgi:hypothetical protein